MIKDIPTAKDFFNMGLSLLDNSWNTTLGLLSDLDEGHYFGAVSSTSDTERFWKASKLSLSTALAITQQGVEFILKGKISEVSPFLLINMPPKEFPKDSATKDIKFADFKTLDAQDLIRVHNTYAKTRFSEDFTVRFNHLRAKRNTISHTVDKQLNVDATELIESILWFHKELFPQQSFIESRKFFLETSSVSEIHSTDHVGYQLSKEFSLAIQHLSPAMTLEFFGMNKKIRRYACLECSQHYRDYNPDALPMTATLSPNTSTAKTLHCFVCRTNEIVERTSCVEHSCKGNVIFPDENVCATCGCDQ